MTTTLCRLCLILLWAPMTAHAGQITIAAAADLSSVMTELAASFEKQSGDAVRVSFGSSGNLSAEIENGAPFDVFLSADVDYPRRLIALHHGDANSLYVYAVGKLVLWAPRGSLDVQELRWKALEDASVHRIAIANPELAPYGRAAVAALKHSNLFEKVSRKLVFGENLSQAAQFVRSGNADLGMIALAVALSPAMKGKGTYWELPLDSYPRIEQAVVVTSNASDPSAARAFVDFLKLPAAQEVLRRYGFVSPGENKP